MSPRRKKEKFQQLTEFERGRIAGIREGGFPYLAIGAHVQRNSSTVMRVRQQWIEEPQTTQKSGNGQTKNEHRMTHFQNILFLLKMFRL
ncbi:hypothetical protein TNCV_1960531 [Trichonephila clavipes]|nr:hypothetical protein TNCV_1960531 [Trichonephila clavipes]